MGIAGEIKEVNKLSDDVAANFSLNRQLSFFDESKIQRKNTLGAWLAEKVVDYSNLAPSVRSMEVIMENATTHACTLASEVLDLYDVTGNNGPVYVVVFDSGSNFNPRRETMTMDMFGLNHLKELRGFIAALDQFLRGSGNEWPILMYTQRRKMRL